MVMGHSKITSARNFQFLTALPPSVCPCSFYPPSTYVRFSELPPPLSKKFRNVYEFSNEKSETEKREKNQFFCKLDIKDQCFLHSYKQVNVSWVRIRWISLLE